MTALVEWQAKRLLADAGVLVPEGRVVLADEDVRAAAAEVGLPCAVKAQVRVGDRAASGLVRRADDVDEAAAARAAMVGSVVAGQPVGTVLLEPWLPLEAELYVAVLSDLEARVPVLLTSMVGGSGIEGREAELVRTPLPADLDVPDHGLRELVRTRLGRIGPDTVALVETLRALLDVYRRNDCFLVEVNPLALVDGRWIAVDAKVRVDGDALLLAGRGADRAIEEVLYADREATERERIAIDIDRRDHRGSVHYVELDPGGRAAREQGLRPVAMHCVGTGASLVLMDELRVLGLAPANFCDTSGSPSEEKVHEITRIVLEQEGIEAYVFLSAFATQELRTTAAGIARALRDVRERAGGSLPFPVLIALRGNQDVEALADLRDAGVLDDPDRSLMGRDATERSVAERLAELIGIAPDAGDGGGPAHD